MHFISPTFIILYLIACVVYRATREFLSMPITVVF